MSPLEFRCQRLTVEGTVGIATPTEPFATFTIGANDGRQECFIESLNRRQARELVSQLQRWLISTTPPSPSWPEDLESAQKKAGGGFAMSPALPIKRGSLSEFRPCEPIRCEFLFDGSGERCSVKNARWTIQSVEPRVMVDGRAGRDVFCCATHGREGSRFGLAFVVSNSPLAEGSR